jgi:heme exporter protein A
MLTFHNISAKRNGKTLFYELGSTLFPGACLFVTGRNAVGKSTLLKSLATLIPTDSGDIFFNSVNIKLALDKFYNLLAYIGRHEILDKDQTVLKNLEFWGKLYNQEEKLLAAITTFSLEPYVDTEVFKLSQGFSKRVLLARLLLTNAKLWLLDDPFEKLDRYGYEILINLIKAMCGQNGIVIIATRSNHTPIEHACQINLDDFCYE